MKATTTAPYLAQLIALGVALLVSGCGKTPQQSLEKAIRLYQEGDVAQMGVIRENLLAASAQTAIDANSAASDGRLLYRQGDDQVTVLYPHAGKMTATGMRGITAFDVNDRHMAWTDGDTLHVSGAGLAGMKSAAVGEVKGKVLALAVLDAGVIFYKKNMLYLHDYEQNSATLFLHEEFPVPYARYYTVRLSRWNNLVAVLTGSAGSYYLSLVDTIDRSIPVKNLTLASSKFYVSADTVYYMQGSSGNWELTGYALPGKNKKTVRRFSELSDIDLGAAGYLYDDGRGLKAGGYDGSPEIALPFPYILAGSCGDRILLQYESKIYPVDLTQLLGNLATLQAGIPGLFGQK